MVQMVPDSLMVFSGNANPKLAQAVVQHLNIPLGRATVSRFSDGEVQVELNENGSRPRCFHHPTNLPADK